MLIKIDADCVLRSHVLFWGQCMCAREQPNLHLVSYTELRNAHALFSLGRGVRV
jgi:hypothetical protein